MDNWMTETGKPSPRPVEDGAINPHGSGGSVLVHKQIWDNFVLSMDMKISKGCNSGIFLRIFPLTPNSRERAYSSMGLRSRWMTPQAPVTMTWAPFMTL